MLSDFYNNIYKLVSGKTSGLLQCADLPHRSPLHSRFAVARFNVLTQDWT